MGMAVSRLGFRSGVEGKGHCGLVCIRPTENGRPCRDGTL